jgi:hypothetical protein
MLVLWVRHGQKGLWLYVLIDEKAGASPFQKETYEKDIVETCKYYFYMIGSCILFCVS